MHSFSDLEAILLRLPIRLRFPDDLEAELQAELCNRARPARGLLLSLPLLVFLLGLLTALHTNAQVTLGWPLAWLFAMALLPALSGLAVLLLRARQSVQEVSLLLCGVLTAIFIALLDVEAVLRLTGWPHYLGGAYLAAICLVSRLPQYRSLPVLIPVLLALLAAQAALRPHDFALVMDLAAQGLVFGVGVFGGKLLEHSDRDAWLRLRMQEATSRTDPLTGILNRRGFEDHFATLVRHAGREQKTISLLLLDIDYFKPLNDHYGHSYGDACLRTVGQFLRRFARRPLDQAARFGGEEFVLGLYNCPQDQVLARAEELRQGVELLNIENQGSKVAPYLTVSIGAASFTPDGRCTLADLVREADRLLYEAKQQGRNRVRYGVLAGDLPA